MKHIALLALMGLMGVLTACGQHEQKEADVQAIEVPTPKVYEVHKSEAEWRAQLTPEQYRIVREQGTERAFTGKYWNYKGDGVYLCVACGNSLFDSRTKYKSGSGWPSFYDVIDPEHVGKETDHTFGMVRTEVHCNRCGAHLGHVFSDGPQPTGLRYCINSAALDFAARGEAGQE